MSRICRIVAAMVGTSGKPVTFSSRMRSKIACGKAKDFSRTSVAPSRIVMMSW